MIIPAVITVIALGRSFSMKNLEPGNFYIYDPDSAISNMKVIHRPYTSAHYRIIEKSSDLNDFLDVSGELSLMARQGTFKLQGMGKYLTSEIKREQTVEILVSVYHETLTETFASYAQQRDEWKKRKPGDVGSHYIRSIIYGGRLLVSLQLKATKTEYMEEIKAAVSGSIENMGSLDANVAGELEKLDKQLQGKMTFNAFAFATAGVFTPPNNVESALKLIEEYPDLVKKVNDGKGAPVKVELIPIATIKPDYAVAMKNQMMYSIFDDVTNKYEDLKNAYSAFHDFDIESWTDEQQEKISDYQVKLMKAHEKMVDAITSLDLSETIPLNHFDEALDAYGKGPENIPDKYMRELNALIHTVKQIHYYWFPYTKAVSHYIHWGSINCSLPSSNPIYVGYAATSPITFGNGGDILCLPVEPTSDQEKTLQAKDVDSRITGMTYYTPNGETGSAYCAFCKLENATSVLTFIGRSDCPQEMKLEYNGFFASNKDVISKPICMEFQPDDKIINLYAVPDKAANKIIPLQVKCPTCDKNDDDDEEEDPSRFLTCAVCSR